MSFEMDEEILQDFLIEAAEILEQLSEQLVQLENDPENKDLLNAIFRGFHTVKGGAGFLAVSALVDTCHGAENVFDTLRNGQRTVTSDLMDVILQALDTINAQFAQLQAREEPEAADSELLETLHKLSQPESEDDAAAADDDADVRRASGATNDADGTTPNVSRASGATNDAAADTNVAPPARQTMPMAPPPT